MSSQLRHSLEELLGPIPEPVAITFAEDEPVGMAGSRKPRRPGAPTGSWLAKAMRSMPQLTII